MKPSDFDRVRKAIRKTPDGTFFCDTSPDPGGYFGVDSDVIPVKSISLQDYMLEKEQEQYNSDIAPLREKCNEIMDEQNRIIDEKGAFEVISYLEDQLRLRQDEMRQIGMEAIAGMTGTAGLFYRGG